jgi:membrane protein involved in colicin uptake
MKKTIFVFAMLVLASCGGSSETTPVADSTVVVDSVAVDSTSVGDATENAGNIQADSDKQDGSETK